MLSLTGKHTTFIIAASAAIMLYTSCKQEETSEPIDTEATPVQVVHDMEFIQSDRGSAVMRMNAKTMQHFAFVKDSVSESYDLYPEGFHVKLYTMDGALETEVNSQQAKHVTTAGKEQWSAFGNVVIINHMKEQKVETDTVYWDQSKHMIHTDCYVRMSSPQGVMQGYGLESDEKAENAVVLKPFDSYSVMRDSSDVYISNDTANFVGPRTKAFKSK